MRQALALPVSAKANVRSTLSTKCGRSQNSMIDARTRANVRSASGANVRSTLSAQRVGDREAGIDVTAGAPGHDHQRRHQTDSRNEKASGRRVMRRLPS